MASERTVEIIAALTQAALESTGDLRSQLFALRRMLRRLEPDIDGDRMNAGLATLMGLSLSMLEERGDTLAACHQQYAIDAFRQYSDRA